MPFNAVTYRINKQRREARDLLNKAREIKRRAAKGEAYDWEVDLIPGLCRRAILSARLARSNERIRKIDQSARKR